MKVVYALRALHDVDEILSFIYQHSPGGARNVSFAIEHTVNLCALSPRAGSKTDEPDVYRWPLGKYRYTIFYRLRSDEGIEIVRVLHGARVKDLRQVPDT
jgi:plasmid stabilization system protein ParE